MEQQGPAEQDDETLRLRLQVDQLTTQLQAHQARSAKEVSVRTSLCLLKLHRVYGQREKNHPPSFPTSDKLRLTCAH